MPWLSVADQPVLMADFDITAWLLGPMVEGSYWMITRLVEWMATSTDPNIADPAYAMQVEAMRRISFLVIPAMAMLALIFAISKGSFRQALTTFTIAIPVAILGVPASFFLVRLLQSIDDTLTRSIVSIADDKAYKFLDDLQAYSTQGFGLLGVGTIVLCIITTLVLLIACVGLLAEFLFREVMLIMAVLFLPLALAFAVFAPLRGFLFKMIEIVIVLVFARFVAVAIFYFGLGIGASAMEQDQLGSFGNLTSALILSTMVVVMAGFSLPALITFALGDNPVSQSSSREVFRETPFSLGSGRADARSAAVGGIKAGTGKVLKSLGR